jgi:hypothetical protein
MAPLALVIPLVLTAVGTGVAAVGAVRSAQAQSNAANYNAQVAQQNAVATRAQGDAAAQLQARESQRQQGSAVALYGAAGVDASAGSPSDVLADSAREATLQQSTTRFNYNMRALGFTDQAALDAAQAKNSMSAGWLNMTSDILTGAGQFYKQGHDMGWGSSMGGGSD